MWDLLFDIDVANGPFVIAMYVIASAFFVYLLGRGDGWSWVLTVVVLLIVGAMIGAAALWMGANLLGLFDRPIPDAAWWWLPAASAGIMLAIWNLWHSRWWRKVIAVVAMPVFVFTALLGTAAFS